MIACWQLRSMALLGLHYARNLQSVRKKKPRNRDLPANTIRYQSYSVRIATSGSLLSRLVRSKQRRHLYPRKPSTCYFLLVDEADEVMNISCGQLTRRPCFNVFAVVSRVLLKTSPCPSATFRRARGCPVQCQTHSRWILSCQGINGRAFTCFFFLFFMGFFLTLAQLGVYGDFQSNCTPLNLQR